MKRGKLYGFSRFFVRLGIGRWDADVPPPEGPTAYICSHGNLRGPLATLCWLPFPVRPWVLHVFVDKETCRAQYRDYTFSKRFGMSKPLAATAAWAVSGYVSALMRSLGAIPVYRGMAQVRETFRQSVAALQAGDSVLIFPNVDYTDESGDVGEVYEGFLLLERFWRRISDKPLRFVPLRLDTEGKRITTGRTAVFDRSSQWKLEMERVREALRAEMNGG
ncbi:MAG: hypothetical protein K2N78_11010 [Oscillospiraceae bacterium]|nr:hypothetical protein [Oscillospiraceae bacterium]